MLLVQQNDHWILGSIELYMLTLIMCDVIPEILFAAVYLVTAFPSQMVRLVFRMMHIGWIRENAVMIKVIMCMWKNDDCSAHWRSGI